MLDLLAQLGPTEPLVRGTLLLTLLLPLAGAGLALAGPRGLPRAGFAAALITSIATLLLTSLLAAVHLADPSILAVNRGPQTFVMLASSLTLAADGISIWLIVLTALLTVLSVAASRNTILSQSCGFYSLVMLLETAMLGVFLVRDLLWFYIFFEFTVIPLFFIISVWGGPGRHAAAVKFFVYTLAGTLVTLATFLYMGAVAGSFDFAVLGREIPRLPVATQLLLFAGMSLGMAIKVPLFPLHTWLPAAHTEAPTGGSVLLAGVLLKLGTYGFLRIGLGMLPAAAVAAAPVMACLAVIGIIYGAMAAWAQADFKRLIAYSSVAHLGFCMLGIFSLRPAGLVGSVLVMVNHGLSTGALFLVVGMIYDRYHTRRFDQLGGLAKRMPALAFFLVLFALSSLGLPGLNGFVSEFLVLLGSMGAGTAGAGDGPADLVQLPALGFWFTAFAAFGIVLSAVYLLFLVGRLLFGPLVEPADHHREHASLPRDANVREWSILTPLAVLVVLLGLWPAPVTRSIGRSTDLLLGHVARSVESPPAKGTDLDETKTLNAETQRHRE